MNPTPTPGVITPDPLASQRYIFGVKPIRAGINFTQTWNY